VGGRYDRVGAREKRIKLKMLQSSNAGKRSIKSVLLGEREGKRGEYLCEAKVYSWNFARARGLTVYLFFFRLIGFKEFKIV
jgi:hypothetical protein